MSKNNTKVKFTVRADEIAEGDTIKDLKNGDTWQVVSEPQYTSKGITLEVMPLDDDEVSCFIHAKPQQRFELVSYQPAQPPAIEPTKDPCFVCSHVHQGQLIGILVDDAGFTYTIFLPGLSFIESRIHYPNTEAALSAATGRVEEECRWKAGFQSYERGEPFPKIADADFARGWKDGLEAHGGVPSSIAA